MLKIHFLSFVSYEKMVIATKDSMVHVVSVRQWSLKLKSTRMYFIPYMYLASS